MPPLPSLESFQQNCIRNNEIIDIVATSESGRTATLKVPSSILNSLSATFVLDIARVRLDQGPLTHYYDRFILHYDDDDPEAWQVLLYWAHHHRFLPGYDWSWDSELLIQAWLLGQAHSIQGFQDDIMIELLQVQNCIDLSYLDMAFTQTSIESPLRRVLVEEVVFQYKEHTMSGAEEDLDEYGQIRGFTSAFAAAMDRYRREGEEMFERLPTERKKRDKWLEYMVDKESKKDWIWVHNEVGHGGRFVR